MKPIVLVACLAFSAAAFAATPESPSVAIPNGFASAGCAITFHPPNQTVGIAGGFLWIDVAVSEPDCPWTVSTATWAVLKSPAAGAGSFTLALEIERNTGPGRVAIIRVGSAEFLLRQLGVREIRPVHGDFSGDGAADLALFRPSTGGWWIPRLFVTTVGGLFQLPVPGDYDGDAVTDPATYELKTGIWRFADGSTVAWGRVGDIPVPADYNGDGRTDIAVFRPSTGRWFILNGETFDWGLPADIPIAADFDGDGRADPAVFRRSTGTWWIRGIGAWMWGRGGDIPVAADYDGDGRADIAVFRPGTGQWFVRDQFTIVYGRGGDLPVPLDYDGDGRADIAVYRRAGNLWFINGYGAGIPWGQPGDLPAAIATKEWLISADDYDGRAGRDQGFVYPYVGYPPMTLYPLKWSFNHEIFGVYYDRTRATDFDGDGRVDYVIFHPTQDYQVASVPSSWAVRLSSTGSIESYGSWGLSRDALVPADYDGDRKADLMVFRASEGRWYLKTSTTRFIPSTTIDWGLPDDIAVPADYDGDGRCDLAVFRPSNGRWYVQRSTDASMMIVDWGLDTDTPVPADFDGDGLTDVAVFRRSTGEWWVRYSSTGFSTYSTTIFGGDGDVPLPGDHDGDGLAEPAYFRNGVGFAVQGLGVYVAQGSPIRQR